jgi:hypothetical protein
VIALKGRSLSSFSPIKGKKLGAVRPKMSENGRRKRGDDALALAAGKTIRDAALSRALRSEQQRADG